MYVLGSSLSRLPILSLQNGQLVALVTGVIINPDDLEMIAIYCGGNLRRKPSAVILTRDIREIAREGLIIDSLDDIEDASEIVRLKAVIDRNFNLIGLEVVNQSNDKLGKVEDYTLDVETYKIQKLYVKQSLLKNVLLNNLVIDRVQIVDITPKQIIVRDATVKDTPKVLAPHPLPQD